MSSSQVASAHSTARANETLGRQFFAEQDRVRGGPVAELCAPDYRASIAAQRLLVTNYPTSPKVPDALLNVASAQSDLNDNAAARRTLEELIAKYPKSDAGTRAKQRLGNR